MAAPHSPRNIILYEHHKLEPSWDQTYPLAADLVMGAVTPAEQQAEADRMVDIIQKERWRPHVVLDLAAWGHGHDALLDDDLKTRYQSDLVQGLTYNNLSSRGRGGSSMSHGYYGEHFYSEWSPNTVRAWDAAGKIPEHRHPANRYRMYKQADLEQLNQQVELSLTPPSAPRKRSKPR